MHRVLECRRHERTGAAGAVVISGGGISHCHCHGAGAAGAAGAVFSYTAALGLCSRRKANISEGRLNRKAKVFCTCIFCWSCLPTRRRLLTCMSCHPSQEICSRLAVDQVDTRRYSSPLPIRTVSASIAKSYAGDRTLRSTLRAASYEMPHCIL